MSPSCTERELAGAGQCILQTINPLQHVTARHLSILTGGIRQKLLNQKLSWVFDGAVRYPNHGVAPVEYFFLSWP